MKAKELQAVLRRVARLMEGSKGTKADALKALADALPSSNASVQDLVLAARRRREVGDQA
jgi:hypothetical protein